MASNSGIRERHTHFFNHVKTKCVKDHENPVLGYKMITLKCKFYGEHTKIGNTRETSSYKGNCPYYITITQKTRGTGNVLQIVSFNNVHNHDLSESLFKHMPKQRKELVSEFTPYLESAFEAKANYRVLQSQINQNNDHAGIVTLKDLYNAKAKHLKKEDRNEN